MTRVKDEHNTEPHFFPFISYFCGSVFDAFLKSDPQNMNTEYFEFDKAKNTKDE